MADRSSRGWESVLPALAVVALAAAGLAFFTDDDPALERTLTGPTVAAIASDPERYDGRAVTVEATVLEPARELPAGADGGFLVAGDEARRVLVIPSRNGAANGLDEGDLVEVHGVVQAPQTAADERAPETPPETRADLLARTGAEALVVDARIRALGR